MRFKLSFLSIILAIVLFCPFVNVSARENVSDWYIKDFQTKIAVDKDSSLLITEMITADCGQAADKHGIFRILPTQIKTAQGTINTPVELVSISDFNKHLIYYTQTRDGFKHTVTWKIGDASQPVTGVNYYKIVYRVKNAIRTANDKFDELYWNLNGNFWDLETDNFSAEILLPAGANQQNSQVEYYTGYLGEKNKDLASFHWMGENAIKFSSVGTLLAKQGITASITFPKGLVVPYEPSFGELYGEYLWCLLGLMVFIICFLLWQKYGKDPRVDKTIIPEFGIPGNLTPLELGTLKDNGTFNNNFITAAIIDLAVKGYIKIEEIENKILFFTGKDYLLTKTKSPDDLGPAEKILVNRLFSACDMVALSSLKNKFYNNINDIKKSTINSLNEKQYINKTGLEYRTLFITIGVILFGIGVSTIGLMNTFVFSEFLTINLFVSAVIFWIFSIIMPKRTPAGAELNWQIKGFKLYMETAEKYRQQFNEKENIFEKFLPYAIVFGLTKQWIKKMQEIYGQEYFNTYAPVWFVGMNMGHFDVSGLTAQMESLSSAISSNVSSSPSGSGGAGGSGGGGGGGGGGGW